MSASSSCSSLSSSNSSAYSSLSIGNSVSSVNSKQKALEACLGQVDSLIQSVFSKINMKTLEEWLNQNTHTISMQSPLKPVETNCRRIFDKAMTQEFAKNRRPQDLVLTCSNFYSSNPQRAAQCFELAGKCIDEGDNEGAVGFFTQALRYSKSSVDYAAVPQFYVQSGALDQALLSRLHLSLYQMQDGRIKFAIETLKLCRSESLDTNTLISTLIIVLTLRSSQTPDNVRGAMALALRQKSDVDRIFIYNQIIAYVPTQVEAYTLLSSLVENPEEKRELLIKAANMAPETAVSSVNLPPYPQELKDFLAGECTVWPGNKRSRTHIVVPLFPEVAIKRAMVPATLDSVDKSDRSTGGKGIINIWKHIPKHNEDRRGFCYGVMTYDVIPGSENKPYAEQETLLPPGYEAPEALHAVRALLWANRQSIEHHFKGVSKHIYTRCKDIVKGRQLAVGSLDHEGLRLTTDFHTSNKLYGIAGWRTFKVSGVS